MARRVHIASKIPRDFNSRVLSRILPDQGEIANYNKDQLQQLLIYRKRIESILAKDPVRFFIPNPGAQQRFMTTWDTDMSKIVMILAAGNKVGKTTGSVIMALEQVLGRALWGVDKRKGLVNWPVPRVVIHFSEDFDSHKETILPNILSWCPKGEIDKIYYNNMAQPTELTFKNGSVYRFKTYAQGSDTAEGKDWDLVVCDEPPPRDLYTGVFRGLVATGGRMIIAATLLKEAWLYDEQENPYVELVGGSIHENLWINEDAKEAFLATLTPEEREVREYGKPTSLVGVIYKSFKDSAPYVIPIHPLPARCPYGVAVDPHERKPVHAIWFYIRPNNEIVWIGWKKAAGSITEIFDQLRKYEKYLEIPTPVMLCVMDPNRGSAIQLGGSSWEQEFLKQGYDVVLGQDDMKIGHSKMYEYLSINELTGRPKMMWTEECRGYGGPVYQMQRYAWDDWARGSKMNRDKKEKPRQQYKDYPDCHRYVAMEELEYDRIYYGPKAIPLHGENFRPYGRMLN